MSGLEETVIKNAQSSTNNRALSNDIEIKNLPPNLSSLSDISEAPEYRNTLEALNVHPKLIKRWRDARNIPANSNTGWAINPYIYLHVMYNIDSSAHTDTLSRYCMCN